MFERLKPMQRIKAVKEYQDALACGARPGETENPPFSAAGLGFAPCSNSPARTKSTLSALRLVRNCAGAIT